VHVAGRRSLCSRFVCSRLGWSAPVLTKPSLEALRHRHSHGNATLQHWALGRLNPPTLSSNTMSEPYPTLRFRDSPSSLDSSTPADSNSIYSTSSWSTTFAGIGSLSGRFIYGIGKAILRQVEDVVIRRRISYIQSLCPLSDDNPPEDVEQIYYDLLELVRYVTHWNVASKLGSDDFWYRPKLYPKRFKQQALQVIGEQLKRGETHYLVSAFSRWHSEEGIMIVREIMYAI
jgi:hypothetical protein